MASEDAVSRKDQESIERMRKARSASVYALACVLGALEPFEGDAGLEADVLVSALLHCGLAHMAVGALAARDEDGLT